jgi:hypothetical protein
MPYANALNVQRPEVPEAVEGARRQIRKRITAEIPVMRIPGGNEECELKVAGWRFSRKWITCARRAAGNRI